MKGCVVKAVEVDLDVEFYFFVKSVRLIEQAHSKTGRRARETKEQLNNITGSKKKLEKRPHSQLNLQAFQHIQYKAY